MARAYTQARERVDRDEPVGPSLATALLQDAITNRATDIHVDPCGGHYRVRFRVDGSLIGAVAGDAVEGQRLINQFRVLSKVDPNEVHLTESRWSGVVDDQTVDLRCTIVPTIDGDKLCIRLFSRHAAGLGLDELFSSDRTRGNIQDWLQSRTGMMVVVGPTGSGKTTLLYALMTELDSPDCSVISLEDPVERRISNITQIEVHVSQSELNFADAAKASLRLDPDYLMIGETRDAETAAAAVTSANSGRALLTSMHGEDLGSVVENLRNWGVSDRELAGALRCVVATRLVRRLCDKCKVTGDITAPDLEWLKSNGEPQWKETPQPVGCKACSGTGYRGRIGLHRMWRLTKDDRSRISQSEAASSMVPVAGSFRERGIDLVRSAETSVAELRRARLPQL